MKTMLISDAAKEVHVESHVLRYWEEELNLPIKRNEMGHRFYTPSDVERFKEIKQMKESGMQLKAIKSAMQEDKTQKAEKFRWLMTQIFQETIEQNNAALCTEIKEAVIKELNYQFQMQEEREEERDKNRQTRDEEYYKRMDELLRKKTKKKRHLIF